MQSINFNSGFIDWFHNAKKHPKDKIIKAAQEAIPKNLPIPVVSPAVTSAIPVPTPVVEVPAPVIEIPATVIEVPTLVIETPPDLLLHPIEIPEMIAEMVPTIEVPTEIPVAPLVERSMTVIETATTVTTTSVAQRILAKLTLRNFAYLLLVASAVACVAYVVYKWKFSQKVPEKTPVPIAEIPEVVEKVPEVQETPVIEQQDVEHYKATPIAKSSWSAEGIMKVAALGLSSFFATAFFNKKSSNYDKQQSSTPSHQSVSNLSDHSPVPNNPAIKQLIQKEESFEKIAQEMFSEIAGKQNALFLNSERLVFDNTASQERARIEGERLFHFKQLEQLDTFLLNEQKKIGEIASEEKTSFTKLEGFSKQLAAAYRKTQERDKLLQENETNIQQLKQLDTFSQEAAVWREGSQRFRSDIALPQSINKNGVLSVLRELSENPVKYSRLSSENPSTHGSPSTIFQGGLKQSNSAHRTSLSKSRKQSFQEEKKLSEGSQRFRSDIAPRIEPIVRSTSGPISLNQRHSGSASPSPNSKGAIPIINGVTPFVSDSLAIRTKSPSENRVPDDKLTSTEIIKQLKALERQYLERQYNESEKIHSPPANTSSNLFGSFDDSNLAGITASTSPVRYY